MAKVCIICNKELSSGKAYRVKEDIIIRTIRKIKNALKIAYNNELFVCENDVKIHDEKRKKFERMLVLYIAFALIVVVLLIAIPLLAGTITIPGIFFSLLLGVILLIVPIIFTYAPARESELSEIKINNVAYLHEKKKELEKVSERKAKKK